MPNLQRAICAPVFVMASLTLASSTKAQTAAVINPDNHRSVKFAYSHSGEAVYYTIAQGTSSCGQNSGKSINWRDPECWSGIGEAPDFIGSVLSDHGYAVDYFEAADMPAILPGDYDVVFVQDPLRDHLRQFDKATVDGNLPDLPDLLEYVSDSTFLDRLNDYVMAGGKLILVGDAVQLLEDGPGSLNYGKTTNTVSASHSVTQPDSDVLPPRWLFVRGNPFCCLDRIGSGDQVVAASELVSPGATIAALELNEHNDIPIVTSWSESVYHPADGTSLLDVQVAGNGEYVLDGSICSPPVHTVSVNDLLTHVMGYTTYQGHAIYYIGSDNFFDFEHFDYDGAWHCSSPDYRMMRNTLTGAAKDAVIQLVNYSLSQCAGVRNLSQPRPFYCAEETKTVTIVLDPPEGTQAIALEDSPPAGWTDVQNISDNGTYDSVNHKVKWGPFFAPSPTSVSYEVIPPVEASGESCFTVSVSLDGESEAICGDTCIDESCCPFAPADDARPACSDCADCSCGGGCQDGRVELCEVIGYACAWQNGCNDDLNGMTRSAFLWVSGECYCWDDGEQNWMSHACESPASGCCSATPLAQGPLGSPSYGMTPFIKATMTELPRGATESSDLSSHRPARRDRVVGEIAIDVPTEAGAMALEIQVPRGWKVVRESDAGVWDDVHRKIKWGPYFDGFARSVRFEVQRVSPRASVHGFRGTISVDGVGHPLIVDWSRAKR